MPSRSLRLGILLVAALPLSSCGTSPGPAGPADGDVDAGTDADGDLEPSQDARPSDADRDESPDADEAGPLTLSGPGPVTFVNVEANAVVDRVCDLDGDGTLDNAFADLGASADLLIMALQAGLTPDSLLSKPPIVHFPLIADRAAPTDPDAVALLFRGIDDDDDPSDNLSGQEPFWAGDYFLDDCGEPLYALQDTAIDRGQLRARGGNAFVTLGRSFPISNARLEGTLEPGCASAELLLCGVALIRDLGELAVLGAADDLSMLEAFLAGGAAFGVATVPGVTPDVDVDGDGIERVLLDETFHVEACVDGDMTVISGPDCWRDARIADGISATVRLTGLPATFLGREPGWEEHVEGPCGAPPEESLFDPR